MSQRDTDIGGNFAHFATTRRSAVAAAGSADAQERARAYEALIEAYWKPAYRHVRAQWRADNEQAKDLTQAFFLHAIEKGQFDRFDPTRGSFRHYLRMCLDAFVSNARKAGARLKRGGGRAPLSLERLAQDAPAAFEPADRSADPQEAFEQEWARSILTLAVDALRRQCAASSKDVLFRLFEAYDLHEGDPADRPTYSQLAERAGIPVTQVTNHLAAARRMLRAAVSDCLRACSGDEHELERDLRALLGGPP